MVSEWLNDKQWQQSVAFLTAKITMELIRRLFLTLIKRDKGEIIRFRGEGQVVCYFVNSIIMGRTPVLIISIDVYTVA